MSKIKVFNDPLYGLIQFKNEILYEIIDEPIFQRLRRINQMGLSDLVYSGATHPRFQHVIGATFLLQKAMDILRAKGHDISDDEYLATSIAILCHDLGHGPFSHTLEGLIVPLHHEEITKIFLQNLKKKYGDIVQLSINIFNNEYPKKFLNQLISSQLDMDRLDYLSRDSYYTGVVEGIVGYDRILNMINVVDNSIVIEEKGVHSVEKFLIARYMMYRQVYLHKTSLSAEYMLKRIVSLSQEEHRLGNSIRLTEALLKCFENKDNLNDKETLIYYFSLLDDHDIWHLIKENTNHSNILLKFLCQSLLNRKLFKVSLHPQKAFPADKAIKLSSKWSEELDLQHYGIVELTCYEEGSQAIMVKTKEGSVVDLLEYTGLNGLLQRNEKIYYQIKPKHDMDINITIDGKNN